MHKSVSMWRRYNMDSVSKNIWLMGLVSFLQNISSIMVTSMTPTLLIVILGGNTVHLGVIRGFSEGMTHFVKVFSGYLSDYFGKRKIFLIIGYWAAVFTKPIFSFVTEIWMYAFAQTMDRITNGFRDAPRDALVSESASKGVLTTSFGIRQGLAYAGSTIGAIVCYYVIQYVGEHNVRMVYLYAMIPVVMAACTVFFLEEPKTIRKNGERIKISDMAAAPKEYVILLAVALVYMLSRFSDSLLIRHIQTYNVSLKYTPLFLLSYYFASFIFAKIIGIAADKISRLVCLAFCFIGLSISYIMMGYASNLFWLYLGMFFSGIQLGATQTVFLSMITEYVPTYIRGTAFGIYGIVCAVGIMLSSMIFGNIYDTFGPKLAFGIFSLLPIIASFMLLGLRNKHNNKEIND